MIKLNYNATFSFTGKEAGDSAGPDIVYKCWVNKAGNFVDSIIKFSESEGKDTEAALEFVGSALISVSQDGQEYPIGNWENAKALMLSIEEQNPGYGDSYMRNLAWAIYTMRKAEEEKRLGNSPEQLAEYDNGTEKVAA